MNVIVVTYIGSPWLQDCLASLRDCKYPIYIAVNTRAFNWYERAGLDLGLELYDDFVLLQDSVVVKDLSFLEVMENHVGPMSFGHEYLMYLGKYTHDEAFVLSKYPHGYTKQAAVDFELGPMKQIARAHNIPSLCPEFTDTAVFVDKYGKKRMVLENRYLIKYKNCWDTNMIDGADKVQ